MTKKDAEKSEKENSNDYKQNKDRKEISKKAEPVDESNLGPDSIVEYRGMKMTVSQREEYKEMEEEQIQKFK